MVKIIEDLICIKLIERKVIKEGSRFYVKILILICGLCKALKFLCHTEHEVDY